MFHSLYAAVSLGFLSYQPSSMGKPSKFARWERETRQYVQYPRHLHSKGYKGTGLSQSLNSCRTSKRGIADKPQCPSNSFRLQILIAFTIESGKSSAYFIRRAFIFLLEQSLFYNAPYIGQLLQSLSSRRGQNGEESARHSLPLFPFPVLQKYASHRPSHTDKLFKTSPNNISCTGFTLSECTKIKTQKLLRWGMWRVAQRIARSFSGSIVAVMGDDIKCEKEGVRN